MKILRLRSSRHGTRGTSGEVPRRDWTGTERKRLDYLGGFVSSSPPPLQTFTRDLAQDFTVGLPVDTRNRRGQDGPFLHTSVSVYSHFWTGCRRDVWDGSCTVGEPVHVCVWTCVCETSQEVDQSRLPRTPPGDETGLGGYECQGGRLRDHYESPERFRGCLGSLTSGHRQPIQSIASWSGFLSDDNTLSGLVF